MFASQEMFMLLFSVLYGIMLNSLIGYGAFPITSAIAGEDAVGGEKKDKDRFKVRWESGSKSRYRFLLSLVLLNFAPFLYFASSFHFIGFFFRELFSFWFVLLVVFIGFLSLGVFAFYYFFLGLAICESSSFYTTFELDRIKQEKLIYKDSWSHIKAGFAYLIPWLSCASIWLLFALLSAICSLFDLTALL